MKKLKNSLNKFIFALLAPLSMSAVEYNSDIAISSESPKFFQSSCIKFSGTLFDYFDNDQRAWLISPKVSYFLGGRTGFTIAGGIRHDISAISLGNHLFFNVLNDGSGSVYQWGKSFDILHDKWDLRINYYFPSKVKIPEFSMLYETASMLEGEFMYKTPFLAFGVHDVYNFRAQQNCTSLKFILPFERFSVGSNLSFQKDTPLKMGLSLTYNFLSSAKKDNKSKNALYRHIPHFERKPLHVEPQKQEIAPQPNVFPVITPESEIKPVPEEIEPEPVEAPPEQSWWDWLFSGNSYQSDPYPSIDYPISDSSGSYSSHAAADIGSGPILPAAADSGNVSVEWDAVSSDSSSIGDAGIINAH